LIFDVMSLLLYIWLSLHSMIKICLFLRYLNIAAVNLKALTEFDLVRRAYRLTYSLPYAKAGTVCQDGTARQHWLARWRLGFVKSFRIRSEQAARCVL
jgi:hypothetical protein